jgi:glyoxylate/hydroxypyruvate reductase A
MTTLLFASSLDSPQTWQEALQRSMPDYEVRVWPDAGNRADIDYAVVWKPPADSLRALPNLKAIFSLGAGVDYVFTNTELPEDVPVVRLIDPALTEGMTEYVLYHVLRYHRHMAEYESQQRQHVWHELPQVRPGDRRIGIMGLGVIGGDAAGKLTLLGFSVAGWSRSVKRLPQVRSFFGRDQLEAFLRRSEILVCVLPLTPDTAGILNKSTLVALPRGACLISAGRGGHVVEEDLLAALESGHIAGATLDVFRTEPLPPDHPFWTHPKVTLTPHIASITNPHTASAQVAENIRRLQQGEALVGVVDRQRRY